MPKPAKILILFICLSFYPTPGQELPVSAQNFPFVPGFVDTTFTLPFFNPARITEFLTESIDYYGFSFGNHEYDYRREYDPAFKKVERVQYITFRKLDERSVAGTGVFYNQQMNVAQYRSLEMDHYNNYFAFIDTTSGKISFAGPQLWAVYSREILPGINFGTSIDYSITHGLKDKYTKCELYNTWFRPVLGFNLHPGRIISLSVNSGVYVRHSTHESVKEYLDALNRIFYGYHIAGVENPRSKNIKRENEINYSGSLSLVLKNPHSRTNFLMIDFCRILSETEISSGSSSKPTKRGIWNRSHDELNVISGMNFPFKTVFRVAYKLAKTEDWAETGHFHVIFLENRENRSEINFSMEIKPSDKLSLMAIYDIKKRNIDYKEYNSDFNYNALLHSQVHKEILEFQPNILNKLVISVSVSETEPMFFWETDKFRMTGIDVSYERRFLFGTIGLSLSASNWQPEEVNKQINTTGLVCYLVR